MRCGVMGYDHPNRPARRAQAPFGLGETRMEAPPGRTAQALADMEEGSVMEIAAGGNIFIRPNRLEKAGDRTEGHKHNFDHVTIVYAGGIHVSATLPNGEKIEREFRAPAHCLIRADV